MVLEFVVDKLGRGVVVAFYLVADDFYFLVELCLWIGGVEDDVGEKVYGSGHMVVEDGCIVDGGLFCGVSLEVAPYALQAVENVPGSATNSSFEGGVLAEVCKSLLAW